MSNNTNRNAMEHSPPFPTMALPPPLVPHDFSLTAKNTSNQENLIVPGTLGRALQSVQMTINSDGTITPPGSGTSTAPGSPSGRSKPTRQNSGSNTPRTRDHATTLSIPGMTRSKVSPNGKIAQRDAGAKLVIVMVGLPARGKSYITNKLERFISWQQFDVKIFNVGNRRRIAAGTTSPPTSRPSSPQKNTREMNGLSESATMDRHLQAAHILLNGVDPLEGMESKPTIETIIEEEPKDIEEEPEHDDILPLPSSEPMDQSAKFFDPNNEEAKRIREQVALSTLDELLHYLLHENGSVGILDATNSTLERRKVIYDQIKKANSKLGVLFIESVCEDKKLLEANMRMKLRGPDYKDKDPVKSLADFKERVKAYESAYVPLGQYEEDNKLPYIKMIDVGRKVIQCSLRGFLSSSIASYLATSFNLSPRQIWLTRHGKSMDNELGKIGGNSALTEDGEDYSVALYNFIDKKRHAWEKDQKERALDSMKLPHPGDQTPPYPEILGDLDEKNFCVWTSTLTRSVQTAQEFESDDNYDVKAWEMLKELNAGDFEGMTYGEIQEKFGAEYAKRRADKLEYVYPGVGGEGYLQVIARLRDMVREIERIKDHVLIIGHRSICRVLMAYFMDLTRDDIADIEVPLGMLFAIEPKPYGMDFHAYKYNPETFDFDEQIDYKPQKSFDHYH